MGMRVGALYCLIAVSVFCQPVCAFQDYSRFEVAAVRPSTRPPNLPAGAVPSPILQGGPGSPSPGRISYRYISWSALILKAFGIRPMQLVAPRAPLELYDIAATLPADTSKEQFQTMLQNFLTERFNLALHHETRILPVYALTVGKNGPKLKESATAAAPAPPGTRIGGPDSEGFPSLPPGYVGSTAIPSNGRLRIAGQKATLAHLIGWVEGRLDHPIVDQTGLTGQYDFKLEIEWMQRPGAPAGDPLDAAPSVFQALEKLGLKLESKQAPFDVLVVDQIDKVPTEN